MSPQFNCIHDNEFDTCKRDKIFKSLWKHKSRLVEETIDRSEFDNLPINLPDSQNYLILTEAKNPPRMFYTEW